MFDIVKAIQVAEEEAFATLGKRGPLRMAEKARKLAKDRKARRWRSIQLRANASLTGRYAPVTEEELEESEEMRTPRGVTLPEPNPDPDPGILRKLLAWKD